jgi:hypothetical protein
MSMNKNFLLFLVIVIILVLTKVSYSKYCASKPQGCKHEQVEDSILSDDHMDR